MSPLLVPAGRGGASGKELALGAAQRVGGAEGVLEGKQLKPRPDESFSLISVR
jgi:hypothetical protein